MSTEGGELSASRSDDGTLLIRVAGQWQLEGGLPSVEAVLKEIGTGQSPRRIAFETHDLGAWDSSLLTFLVKVADLCKEREIAVDSSALPNGAQRLLGLAAAVPERKGARQETTDTTYLARIGNAVLNLRGPVGEALSFIGQIVIALGRLARGQARLRRADLMLAIQQAGANALGIITLISFLVGTILAFVGAVQLEQFGAAIYVADLVGIAMVREMGAMMTGIVMAGRTGAAYAAQLGTMRVNQETDALVTMGIPPLEFLVLPRMIALCLMMPLLCLYADFVGILGGAFVGTGMLKIGLLTYFQETTKAVHLGDLAGGIFKASVYGVLIAVSGCLRGMQCGRSASAVGDAATSAVVTGIVLIITACGLFAVVFYVLGI